MIFKLLLILSLLHLVAAFILKKTLVKPTNVKNIQTQLDTASLIKKISPYTITESKGKSLTVKGNEAHIPSSIAGSKSIEEQTPVLEAIGLTQLSQIRNLWQKRIQSMVIFDQILLPFAILISVFGVLAKTLNFNIASYIVMGALLLNCLNNFYMTWVRHLAMKLIRERLEGTPLYTKDENRELVTQHLKSYAYRGLMPISLKWIG